MTFALLGRQVITNSEMNWSAIAAIGTILAAAVGVLGIIINLHEKTRRLTLEFSYISSMVLYITNPSLRSVIITSIAMGAKGHFFYAEESKGVHTIKIAPGEMEDIIFNMAKVKQQYQDEGIQALCKPKDRIEIIVRDSYKRRYRVKTELTVDDLRKMS